MQVPQLDVEAVEAAAPHGVARGVAQEVEVPASVVEEVDGEEDSASELASIPSLLLN
jgi:hypothetical protein